MNIPAEYQFGQDSMYLLLKTQSKSTAKTWIETYLNARPKSAKYVRFMLGIDKEITTLRQFIKCNLGEPAIYHEGILMEIDRNIAEEIGDEIVQWLTTASATIKNRVDLLTREQVNTLTPLVGV